MSDYGGNYNNSGNVNVKSTNECCAAFTYSFGRSLR